MKWKDFLFPEKRKGKALASALDRFIQQVYWGEDIDAATAKENLDTGLVEMTRYDQHSSNGLLITDDGYFLTAKHCIDGDMSGLKIRLHDGTLRRLEKVCAWSEREGVALAKTDIAGRTEPRRYRFYTDALKKKTPIAITTRRDGVLVYRYGFVKSPRNTYYFHSTADGKIVSAHHFILDIVAVSGDSGGIVTSADGRLIGFLHASDPKNYLATGVNIIKALEIVHFYKRRYK